MENELAAAIHDKEKFERFKRIENDYKMLYADVPLSSQSFDPTGCFVDVNPFCVFHDITKELQTQDELEKSQRELKSIFKIAPTVTCCEK